MKIRVMVVRPGSDPIVEEHDDTLESMQALVGGLVEQCSIEHKLAFLVNEEGRLNGLPGNFWHPDYGTIVGTAVFVRIVNTENGASWGSLTDEDVDMIRRGYAT